ncbi:MULTISPECIES: pantoate--beta-alanine ligase [unclassified Bradyrhizobium]|uniref:pantoate--beta-alanine ligase n=1 Tax=unclassified Bradyrhizobium TaxID=2631580 RepID=UPI00273B4728|nr:MULTISPECIES: pantoate--beta-alanine ligase [unclassified Bradyrhizobium]
MATDLNLPIDIVAAQTVRDPDQLAMTSRNRRVSATERNRAPFGQSKAVRGRGRASGRGARSRPAVITRQAIHREGRWAANLETVDVETLEPVTSRIASCR